STTRTKQKFNNLQSKIKIENKSRLPKGLKSVKLSSVDSGKEWVVEKIVDKRQKNGKIEYLLKWKGWPSASNTRQQPSRMNCDELIREFEDSKNAASTSTSTSTSSTSTSKKPKKKTTEPKTDLGKEKIIDILRAMTTKKVKNLNLKEKYEAIMMSEHLGLLFNLTALYIDSSQLVEIKSEDFKNMKNLVRLYLSNNFLEEIPNGVFENNPELKTIDLRNNKIILIGSSVFDGLTKLDYVNLERNICIDSYYHGNVQKIEIYDANIKRIPKNIGLLFNLTHFTMINTDLVEIESQDFNGMQDLEVLDLTGNRIELVSIDAFSILTKLKLFSLSYNQLEEISNGVFSNNLNLEQIFLNRNKIKFLGSALFSGLDKLIHVIELHLYHNLLEEIPNGVFSNNLELKTIDLWDNKIKFIGSSVFDGLTKLNDVDLDGNVCINKEYIFYFKNVEAIYIHYTNTKYIPKDLGLLFNLTALDIQSSQLVEIKSEDFKNMKNLVELSLMFNSLEEIPNGVFSNNPELKTISLYGNKIKFIGSSVFDGLTKLDYVELGGNICIRKGYFDSIAIIQLKNDIKSQCKNPNELQPTTTPIPTEAPTTPKVIELSHELTLN
ncbi:unnamed protein product, partial [Diamesa serratosioi]